jgi:hypothetical protein
MYSIRVVNRGIVNLIPNSNPFVPIRYVNDCPSMCNYKSIYLSMSLYIAWVQLEEGHPVYAFNFNTY